jgi:hypothetical protein
VSSIKEYRLCGPGKEVHSHHRSDANALRLFQESMNRRSNGYSPGTYVIVRAEGARLVVVGGLTKTLEEP